MDLCLHQCMAIVFQCRLFIILDKYMELLIYMDKEDLDIRTGDVVIQDLLNVVQEDAEKGFLRGDNKFMNKNLPYFFKN